MLISKDAFVLVTALLEEVRCVIVDGAPESRRPAGAADGGELRITYKDGEVCRYAFDEQNAGGARAVGGRILAIAAVSFLTLIKTTALAEIVGGFLGDLFDPETILGNEWSAVSAALLVSVFTFAAQLVKGLLEYKTAAKARGSMRAKIFSKVLELDAGGI